MPSLLHDFEGVALAWFRGLTPRSVTSFSDLAMKFINRFITSKKLKKGPDYLMTIVQKKDESL